MAGKCTIQKKKKKNNISLQFNLSQTNKFGITSNFYGLETQGKVSQQVSFTAS